MRWRRDTPYPRPKSREKRIRPRFAWWPTHVDNDQTVWLEFFFIEDEWREDGEKDVLAPSGAYITYQGSGWRPLRVFAQRKT